MHGSDTTVSNALREQRNRECQGRLSVQRNGMTGKTRKFVVTSEFGPEHTLGVYNNNVDTIERAFVERYFLCKDGEGYRPSLRVRPQAFRTLELRDFQNRVMLCMPRLPRLTRQQVVDAYHGPKRRNYERALESLSRDELEKSDSYLTSFSKFEKQDLGGAPRIINPRSRRYNLELGRYLKHAEHKYFSAINQAFGGRTAATVIKGYNADVSAGILRAKWSQFTRPVAIGLDAKKFDMHVSVAALKYEHEFYKRLFPGNRWLRTLLKWQLRNKGTAYVDDGRVKFSMEGTRSSGDLNTSLGNCLIMCALVYAYARVRGVDVELANNGDDCVVFLEMDDLQYFEYGLSNWFRRRGFAMTMEDPVDEFEALEFCQTRPVELSTGWRMVRNPSACVTKDPICLISVPNAKVLRKWYWAVGDCGSSLTSGVPVLSAFYNVFLRNGVECGEAMLNYIFKNRTQRQLARGVKEAYVTPVARVSFFYAFGITPDEQVALEDFYSTMVLDVSLSSPIRRENLVVQSGINITTII